MRLLRRRHDLTTGKGGRYRYYKCNTRIGKGIDYCKSENLPMQKLDAMVLNSLADRVFTAARVRLMLEAPARQAKDSGKEQQRQQETLNRELAAATRGMERLYEGIEQGVLKLDDTLRQRTDQLQAQHQAILSDIARLKTKAAVPAHILQQKHIDTLTRLVRAKLPEAISIRWQLCATNSPSPHWGSTHAPPSAGKSALTPTS